FVGDEDTELSRRLYELGFTPTKIPDASRIDALDWADRDAYLARLGGRYRGDLRREVLRREGEFEVVHARPSGDAEIGAVYRIYREVHARSREMNVFPLPYRFFAELCGDPEHDVLRLY